MRQTPSRLSTALPLLSLALLLGLAAGACRSAGPPDRASSQLAFGTQMARQGLWSEALFRFRQAERMEPSNPRIHNNIAVALEALGRFDDALGHYRKALELDPGNREAKANYARFVEFYQGFRPREEKAARPGESAPPRAEAAAPVPEDGAPAPEDGRPPR